MTPLEWIISDDTGISSITIWAVMMGIKDIPRASIPHDPDDFGRCYRLLSKFPEWRERLNEVAERFPRWKRLVGDWDTLTELYEEEEPTGTAPKLYRLMERLRSE
jgi:hypothetical protein